MLNRFTTTQIGGKQVATLDSGYPYFGKQTVNVISSKDPFHAFISIG